MILDRADGEGELCRILSEAGRQNHHEFRHEDLAQDRHDSEPEGHHREGFLGKLLRRAGTFRMQQPGKGRDESSVEGALAKQAAEQVGKFQSDEERIRDRASPDECGDQHVPRESPGYG